MLFVDLFQERETEEVSVMVRLLVCDYRAIARERSEGRPPPSLSLSVFIAAFMSSFCNSKAMRLGRRREIVPECSIKAKQLSYIFHM